MCYSIDNILSVRYVSLALPFMGLLASVSFLVDLFFPEAPFALVSSHTLQWCIKIRTVWCQICAKLHYFVEGIFGLIAAQIKTPNMCPTRNIFIVIN